MKNLKTKLVNPEEIKAVIDYYLETKSIYDVSKKFNYKLSTIYRRLLDNGVDTKRDGIKNGNKIRKFKTNPDFFEKIDTRDKAYVLGLILSDGNVTKEKTIRLKITDIDLLEDVRKRIGHEQPLYLCKKEKQNHKTTKLLVLSNRKMYHDILKHGCCHQKSFNLEFPNLENKLLPDFIRGFFDGDGCVHLTSYNGVKSAEIKIVATKSFCKSLSELLLKFGIKSQKGNDKRNDDRVGDLRIRDKASIYKFYHLIYNNIQGQIFLKRKLETYNFFINHTNENYPDGHKFKQQPSFIQ